MKLFTVSFVLAATCLGQTPSPRSGAIVASIRADVNTAAVKAADVLGSEENERLSEVVSKLEISVVSDLYNLPEVSNPAELRDLEIIAYDLHLVIRASLREESRNRPAQLYVEQDWPTTAPTDARLRVLLHAVLEAAKLDDRAYFLSAKVYPF